MYQRIVLAYDGSREGRRALREGALLGRLCGAELFLLSVTPAFPAANALGEPAATMDAYHKIFEEGLANAQAWGVTLKGHLAQGNPSREISAYAKQIGADLVVVGHRRASFLERWWAASDKTYMMDLLDCSVLVARNEISDADFNERMAATASAIKEEV
ncbi:MAG: universal stress protein [Caulobacterales bacterium]